MRPVAIFAAVLIAGCSQSMPTGPAPASSPPTTPATTPQPPPPRTPELEADDLAAAFSVGRKAAIAEYGGKEIIVTGWAEYFTIGDQAYVKFTRHGATMVYAKVNPSDRAAFEKHFPKTSFTFEGKTFEGNRKKSRIKAKGICGGDDSKGVVHLTNLVLISAD